ncbi:Na+/H+ antiporter subunit E [Sinorhizobium sp. BG8]|uniref:Na+/H+ antiporter subunit E n=1 Tax=Sinorhizobium sp. BG8 TaxID=2613773 RepID=UPI00193D21B5|nr:Na+/H+ antiporter subunit E [Sinorhizobium sp. BG8]QRM57337.1 Na+/H+ antiporter subunit E [Sinorhizobium sp. BG8]
MLPYPLLTASLVGMWLLLNGFSIGHLLLGTLVAVFASWGMAALQPTKPRLRRWYLLPKLVLILLYDIALSNLAVARIILGRRSVSRQSGFVTVPLDLSDDTALAVLSVVLTSTPGTAWVEHNSKEKTLLIHTLDLADENHWRDLIKNRYEKLLMGIFE